MNPEDLDMFGKGLKGFIDVIGPVFKWLLSLFLLPFKLFIKLPIGIQYTVFGIIILIALLILRYFILHFDEIVTDLTD